MDKTSRDKKFTEYRYASTLGSWVEFPIDCPANRFISNLRQSGKLPGKLAPNQLEPAIGHISYDGECRIQKHIYENRIRPRDNSGRRPISFFWEVSDLLEALSVAISGSGVSGKEIPEDYGEVISKRAFEVLAEMMSRKTDEDIAEYPTAIIMTDPTVQHMMLLRFNKDIRKRLDAVWELSHTPHTQNMGRTTIVVLQKLDDLLVHLLDSGESDAGSLQTSGHTTSDNQSSYMKRLEDLYFRLMAIRDSIHTDNILHSPKTYEYGVCFRLPKSDENDEIIHNLAELLFGFNKNNQEKREREFKDAYLRFVSKYAPQDTTIDAAREFFRDYLELERYVHEKSTVADFAEQSRQELYGFAKEVFSNMEKSDLGYSDCFENVFTHAQDTFAYSRLNSIHAEIWSNLHGPLWLLSMQRLIREFAAIEPPYNDYEKEYGRIQKIDQYGELLQKRINQFLFSINQERYALSNRFPQLPLLHNYQPDTVKRFVDAFNTKCPMIYDVNPMSVDQIMRMVSIGQQDIRLLKYNRIVVLEIWAAILKCECELTAVILIDSAVAKLAAEHNLLEDYH